MVKVIKEVLTELELMQRALNPGRVQDDARVARSNKIIDESVKRLKKLDGELLGALDDASAAVQMHVQLLGDVEKRLEAMRNQRRWLKSIIGVNSASEPAAIVQTGREQVHVAMSMLKQSIEKVKARDLALKTVFDNLLP